MRSQLRYRLQQPSAVSKRDAEFIEVAIGEMSERVQIDPVLSKLFLVLTEVETAEPSADIHDRILARVRRALIL
ncbi:MAG TPA: hypothetical protein VMB83_07060 [Roseiarcus sp.]|nr:hypothetical protein [Roseiarcus sp.]